MSPVRCIACATFGAFGLMLANAASPAMAVVTTFDNGTEGWSVSGRTNISPTGGNPGANLDVELIDVFGAETRNSTNADFLGDYSRFNAPIKLAVDMKINSITFFGTEVRRNLVVEMVDYNPPGSDYPYVSVWYDFGEIGADLPGWRNFQTMIDPTQTTLPAGWGGTGDEDPVTFEPRLPPDRTFASVLASVDELRFTTYVPGYFYGFTNFLMQVDNVELSVVPEPGCIGLLATGGLLVLRRRRA
jgi:hypothetical protein